MACGCITKETATALETLGWVYDRDMEHTWLKFDGERIVARRGDATWVHDVEAVQKVTL
jgi:hypothetical protein